MSASTKPVLPCEKNEVVKIALTTIEETNLDNDFIPIVELDKTYKEDGCKYTESNKKTTLSPYIENRDYVLENVLFDNSDEFVLRFHVKKGNPAANDNRGEVKAIGRGVSIISQKEFTIKYDQKILLRVSKKDIKSGAYIDFYANDNDFCYYSVSNVHCGRVQISNKANAQIIFPFKEKPLNDTGSKDYPNRYWGAKAKTNSATFGSGRDSTRDHGGRDLYGRTQATPIVAMCGGKVLRVADFYRGTHQIVIHHKASDGREFIARYCEVWPSSIKVSEGNDVVQGQEIAKVGKMSPAVTIDSKTTNMLHIEIYTDTKKTNVSNKHPLTSSGANRYSRRADVIDPIEILKEGYENTFGDGVAETESTADNENRVAVSTLSISAKGLDFIKSWEGLKMNASKTKHIAYNDSKGYATIGHGHLIQKKKVADISFGSATSISGITKSEFENGITDARALEILKADIQAVEAAIKRDISVPLLQQEYDAIASLLFNAGSNFLNVGGAGKGETKIKKNINKKEYAAGAKEFGDVTNGKEQGLVRRRNAEIDMFNTGVYKNN